MSGPLDPVAYGKRLLTRAVLCASEEEWASTSARELRAVLAALLATCEGVDAELTFSGGQLVGWHQRPFNFDAQ